MGAQDGASVQDPSGNQPTRALGACKSIESSLVLSSCLWVFPFCLFLGVFWGTVSSLMLPLGPRAAESVLLASLEGRAVLVVWARQQKWLKWTEQTMKFIPQSTGCDLSVELKLQIFCISLWSYLSSFSPEYLFTLLKRKFPLLRFSLSLVCQRWF